MHAKQPRTFKVRGCFISTAPLPTKQALRGPRGLKAMEKRSHNDSIKNRYNSRRLQNIENFTILCYNKNESTLYREIII